MLTRIFLLIVGLFLLTGCDRQEKSDFHYKVLSKTYTPGELVKNGDLDNLSSLKITRIDPKYEVVFKGVESGREYPPLVVKETAYKGFMEGAVYDRAALNAARK